MAILSTNWQIITGGPSSGKSATLSSIASLRYKTIPEMARVHIDEETRKGRTIQEIRSSELEFQEKVLEMKNEIEDMLNITELIFFERGIFDSIPYMQLAGSSKEKINNVKSKYKYQNVFLLEQVVYKEDYARIENSEEAQLINNLLFTTYSKMYPLKKVW